LQLFDLKYKSFGDTNKLNTCNLQIKKVHAEHQSIKLYHSEGM